MVDWIRSSNQLTAVWPIQVVATEREGRLVGEFVLKTSTLMAGTLTLQARCRGFELLGAHHQQWSLCPVQWLSTALFLFSCWLGWDIWEPFGS